MARKIIPLRLKGSPMKRNEWSWAIDPLNIFGLRTTDKFGVGEKESEFAAAKEADRLSKHPERDKILKIQKMMDKEREMTDYEKRRKK